MYGENGPIEGLPEHIDTEFDVDGTLFMVYLYPLTGNFEVAQWNDGEEHVIDGFFDPLDLTDYEEYYGDKQLIYFCHNRASQMSYNALESALIETGVNYGCRSIEVETVRIYGHHYEEPDDDDIVDAPYSYDDDTNYW